MGKTLDGCFSLATICSIEHDGQFPLDVCPSGTSASHHHISQGVLTPESRLQNNLTDCLVNERIGACLNFLLYIQTVGSLTGLTRSELFLIPSSVFSALRVYAIAKRKVACCITVLLLSLIPMATNLVCFHAIDCWIYGSHDKYEVFNDQHHCHLLRVGDAEGLWP